LIGNILPDTITYPHTAIHIYDNSCFATHVRYSMGCQWFERNRKFSEKI